MDTSFSASLSLTAAVRASFGLSLRQLGRYLGVSSSFVANVEAGRRHLPPAYTLRLVFLYRLLPPTDAAAVAAEPTYDPLAPLPAPDPLLTAAPGEPHAPEPLRRRLRDCRLRLLEQGQQLTRAQAAAAARAHRRRGLALLQAAPPPADPAEDAHWARWLHELSEDLRLAVLDPAALATDLLVLTARVAGLRAEVALLMAQAGQTGLDWFRLSSVPAPTPAA